MKTLYSLALLFLVVPTVEAEWPIKGKYEVFDNCTKGFMELLKEEHGKVQSSINSNKNSSFPMDEALKSVTASCECLINIMSVTWGFDEYVQNKEGKSALTMQYAQSAGACDNPLPEGLRR